MCCWLNEDEGDNDKFPRFPCITTLTAIKTIVSDVNVENRSNYIIATNNIDKSWLLCVHILSYIFYISRTKFKKIFLSRLNSGDYSGTEKLPWFTPPWRRKLHRFPYVQSNLHEHRITSEQINFTFHLMLRTVRSAFSFTNYIPNLKLRNSVCLLFKCEIEDPLLSLFQAYNLWFQTELQKFGVSECNWA